MCFHINPSIEFVTFCFVPVAKQQSLAYCWLHQHPNYFFTGPFQEDYAFENVNHQ
jgi:hypothetical protein